MRIRDTTALRSLEPGIGVQGPALALGSSERLTLPQAVFLGCAATRCTEVDDIHAGACVTASSVIVPVAVAVASCIRIDGARFLAACAGGLETIVRFGLAAGGPGILYKGIWPTYLAAGFGVAATVGILLGFERDELARALEVVATLATGTTGGRAPGIPSRWVVLGCAAQSALLATLSVRAGVGGDIGFIGERWSEVTGLALAASSLTGALGEIHRAGEISIKPYCAAKQATGAINALQLLIEQENVKPETIADVLVEVPEAYAKMIDQPTMPAARLPSIASVQYQLALVAHAPDRLLDVVRDDLPHGDEIASFMKKVRVGVDPALERYYPARWPARVTVTDSAGRRTVREVVAALGDPEHAPDWSAALQKFERIAFRGDAASSIANHCQQLGKQDTLSLLLEELGRISPVS
jgi:2-methylcitrate dehydratase PrpD